MVRAGLFFCVASLGCREAVPPPPLEEQRATINAVDLAATYEARLMLPPGYQRDGERAQWQLGGKRLSKISIAPLTGARMDAAPCGVFEGVELGGVESARERLPDGFLITCKGARDESLRVIRLMSVRDSQFYCLAQTDRTEELPAHARWCRSVTLSGPHVDDLSPVREEMAVLAIARSRLVVRARIRLPNGYRKVADEPEWRSGDPRKAHWPTIKLRVWRKAPALSASAAEEQTVTDYLGTGAIETKRYEDGRAIWRRLPLAGGTVAIECEISIRGVDNAEQEKQLRDVCASLTAEIGER